ncbi:ABC transporter permease [Candidatus Poribacteria bacterium]
MRTIDFVTKESFRRIRKSVAGVLFILLGIGIFVACQTINKALHDRTKEQLLGFGANIIVQPEGQPFDLYSGTARGNALLPEHYTDSIRSMEHADMLAAVSPKLYEHFQVGDRSLLVVGVTSDERKAKPWWLIDSNVLTTEFPFGKEALLGHYAAANLGGNVTEIKLGDEIFLVSGVLDETGSPDDFMAFVPLAALQKLSKKVGMVNLIEVSTSCISCETMNVNSVAKQIDKALPPSAKVSTVDQIARAQMGTLKKIMGFTTIIYLVVLFLCAFLLINYMSGAVDERRREIGMLLAMGMDPRKIQTVFALKVLAFAVIGGFLGYIVGSGVSMFLGPLVAESSVNPIPYLLPISFAISVGLGVLSSIIPVRRISRLDPVEALREA